MHAKVVFSAEDYVNSMQASHSEGFIADSNSLLSWYLISQFHIKRLLLLGDKSKSLSGGLFCRIILVTALS
jgi:hypothetical protein